MDSNITSSPTTHKHGRGLPNELLLQIFSNVGEQELHSLTLCSRCFNDLALPIYLSYHKIPDPALGTLMLSGKQMNVLAGLQHSLSFTSLNHLSCTFNTGDHFTLTEIRRIDRMLSRLSHIDEMTLDLSWLFSIRLISIPVNWTGWRDAMVVILNRVVEKACTVLTVQDGERIPRAWALLPSTLPDECLQRVTHKKKRSTIKLKRFLGSIRSNIHSKDWQHRRLSADFFPRTSLKTVNIHSPILFHSTLENWTVNTLNMSPITTLSLQHLNLPAPSWERVLARITLPMLSKLTFRVTGHAFADLSRFLSRHPQITTLDLTQLGQRSQADHLEQETMPNLAVISVKAGTLVHILQPTFPLLRFISISAHINQGLQSNEFAFLDRDLARIACHSTTEEITLSLQLSGLFGCMDWLRVYGVERGRNRVERSLHCVTTLRLETNWCFCSSTNLGLLPGWLALFPALRHVIFADYCMKHPDELVLIRSIARSCSGVRTVTINDVETDIAAAISV